MKLALYTACILAAAFILASPAITAGIEAPGTMAIDNYKSEAANLKVNFNHLSHSNYECVECHHQWDPGCGEPPKPCSYSGCHDVMDKKEKSKSSYYKIIHDMRPKEISTCVSCHRETAGGDKEMKKKLAGCRGSVCHP